MNLSQALEIMKPNPMTLDGLKDSFRKQAFKYHPDRNPHGLEMMKVINAANTILQEQSIYWIRESKERKPQFNDDFYNRHIDPSIVEEMEKALEALKKFRNITVEIIGTWIWVSGEAERYDGSLRQAGFWYSPKREAYYWKPADWEPYKQKDKKYSMDKLRDIFGTKEFKTEPDKEFKL